jgi:hypothetical protein
MSRKTGGEVPGQEFLEPVHWMFRDAFKHVAQSVEFRVVSVELRRTEPAVDGRRTLAAGVRASDREQRCAGRVRRMAGRYRASALDRFDSHGAPRQGLAHGGRPCER